MKKVICIKKPMHSSAQEKDNLPRPDVGDEDILTNEKRTQAGIFYYLERFGDDICYASHCFSNTDSDLDETELVTEEFNEKYCVPVNS